MTKLIIVVDIACKGFFRWAERRLCALVKMLGYEDLEAIIPSTHHDFYLERLAEKYNAFILTCDMRDFSSNHRALIISNNKKYECNYTALVKQLHEKLTTGN